MSPAQHSHTRSVPGFHLELITLNPATILIHVSLSCLHVCRHLLQRREPARGMKCEETQHQVARAAASPGPHPGCRPNPEGLETSQRWRPRGRTHMAFRGAALSISGKHSTHFSVLGCTHVSMPQVASKILQRFKGSKTGKARGVHQVQSATGTTHAAEPSRAIRPRVSNHHLRRLKGRSSMHKAPGSCPS